MKKLFNNFIVEGVAASIKDFKAINGVKGFNGGGNTSGKNLVYLVNPV